MFKVEKRDPNSNWYLYSTTSNEFSATALADTVKRAFPRSSVRVMDPRGAVKAIF